MNCSRSPSASSDSSSKSDTRSLLRNTSCVAGVSDWPKREFLRRGSRKDMVITYPPLTMRKKELSKSKLGFSKPAGWSTLHFAAREGNLEIVQSIIQKGSGDLVKLRASCGSTPLHLSVQYNHIPVCDYLLKHHEVEVNAKNSEGFTPLDLAYLNKRKRLIAILTQLGGEINKYDPIAEKRARTTVKL